MTQPVHVPLAKVEHDGHDRGVKMVARLLCDAGMGVIYCGLHRTPDEVVTVAMQEDADVLGVDQLSGTVLPKIFRLLADKGADGIIVVAGVIPDDDAVKIYEMGVREVVLQDVLPEAIDHTRPSTQLRSTCRPQHGTRIRAPITPPARRRATFAAFYEGGRR